MGSSSSKKPEITITAIRSSTEDIRSSLRRKGVTSQSKENLHATLVNNSKQLNTLRLKKSKKKQVEIDQLQKLVSDVSEELLEYNDDHLDKSADESNSFIHMDAYPSKNQQKNEPKIRKGRTSSKSKVTVSNPLTNLNDIEEKLSRIKNDVSVGIKNEDNKLLLLQKKKIEMLSTDLELLNIPESSPLYETAQSLEKDLYKYYQRIIRREKTKARISKVNPEEKIEEQVQIKLNSSRLNAVEIMLEDIHDVLQNTAKGDARGDFEALLEEVGKTETELSKINDNSRENLKFKTILMKKIEQTKKFIKCIAEKKEMNDLDEMMEEIDKLKDKIQDQNNEDKSRFEKSIIELKNKLKDYPVKHDDNMEFRNEYIKELIRFLEKINPNHEGVILRTKVLKSSKSVEDLMHLQEEWKSLEKNISMTKLDDVKTVDAVLQKFEESIRIKRKSLADLLKKTQEKSQRKSDEPIRISAKVFDLPKIQSTKSQESVKKNQQTEEEIPLRYATKEHALKDITKISERVEEIGKSILTFKGTSEDLEYNFFKASLLDKKKILETLTYRLSWNQVDVIKYEVLEKIGYYEEYLKYKLAQNILEQKLIEKLQDLEATIKRFTGSYQNIQFRNIDGELDKCLKEAQNVDNPEESEMLKQRINYLKNILREKSGKGVALKQDENLTDTRKIIAENKEYIKNLKERIHQSTGVDENESLIIEECLLSKTMELINLNLRNDTPMFIDVKKLLEDIDECKSLLRNKRRPTKTSDDVENTLVQIQKEISDFDGLVTDKKYLDLSKHLKDLETDLQKMEETEDGQGKKLELSLRINLLKTTLDQVVIDSEKIFDVENKIKSILEMVSEGVPENDLDRLDEELINLRIQLEKFDVSEKLSYRKIACLNYIEYLLKKINEKHYERNGHISGSVIV